MGTVSSPPGRAPGFTVVELMIAMLIFSIGIMGVYAMQVVTIASSAEAREIAEATNLASRILEGFRRDSTTWTAGIQPPSLQQGAGSSWVRYNSLPIDKDGLTTLQLPATMPTTPPRYCVKYRTSELGGVGSGTYKVEVRVMWPRRQGKEATFARCPTDMDSTENIPYARAVTLAGSIFRHRGEE